MSHPLLEPEAVRTRRAKGVLGLVGALTCGALACGSRADRGTSTPEGPVSEIEAHLPPETEEVQVSGVAGRTRRLARAEDVEVLVGAAGRADGGVVRLLGSHDPYLQLRDRELLVAERAKQKDLWRTLGRPGAVVLDGEVAGTWRPRTAGGALTVTVEPWSTLPRRARAAVQVEAERLAAHRHLRLRAIDGL